MYQVLYTGAPLSNIACCSSDGKHTFFSANGSACTHLAPEHHFRSRPELGDPRRCHTSTVAPFLWCGIQRESESSGFFRYRVLVFWAIFAKARSRTAAHLRHTLTVFSQPPTHGVALVNATGKNTVWNNEVASMHPRSFSSEDNNAEKGDSSSTKTRVTADPVYLNMLIDL